MRYETAEEQYDNKEPKIAINKLTIFERFVINHISIEAMTTELMISSGTHHLLAVVSNQ